MAAHPPEKEPSEHTRMYDHPIAEAPPFSMTVSTFVKRLGENEYHYQLRNGMSLSHVKSERFSELFTKSGTSRLRVNYASHKRISVDQYIVFAGESDNNLYFYSKNHHSGAQNKYIFSKCLHVTPDQLHFENFREVIVKGEPQFAIQQPYFLSDDGKSVESFTGQRLDLQTSIKRSQGFFCWRNTMFVVSREKDSVAPQATFTGRVVQITLPISTEMPHSVYAEDNEFAYLLCGNQLLLIEADLSIVTMYLTGLNNLHFSIAGVSEGQLLINRHDDDGHPAYDMVLSLNFRKCLESIETEESETNSDHLVDESPKQLDHDQQPPQVPRHGRHIPNQNIHHHSVEEADLAQAIQLSLEAEILRMQKTITKLLNEKNTQGDEITRLQKTLMSASLGMVSQSTRSQYDTLEHFTSKFSNDFEIRNVLGAGSFGIVFEAINNYDDWKYAVKRIPVEPNEKKVDKALREVRAMAQLDHPGIVRYNSTWVERPPEGWQVGVDDETLRRFSNTTMPHYPSRAMFIYIQMQLCEYSLSEWLKRQDTTPRDTPRMISWFKQIVSAVAYIHGKGLIHRDLKPSNILFVESDRLKICDLGIVAQLKLQGDEEVAGSLTNTGTPLYMAPEQGGWQYTSKVDVFTLGLILAELCVVMADNERKQIFTNLRCGTPCSKLQNQPRLSSFISWLTQVDHKKRPTCNEVRQHGFRV